MLASSPDRREPFDRGGRRRSSAALDCADGPDAVEAPAREAGRSAARCISALCAGRMATPITEMMATNDQANHA
jgi:hypothetical protein